jgi:prophage regulatory protein
MDDLTLLSIKDAFTILGRKHSSGYSDIAAGLITRPIAYGPQSKRLPLGEVRRIAAARIAGATDDEVRALVVRLHAERKGLVPERAAA